MTDRKAADGVDEEECAALDESLRDGIRQMKALMVLRAALLFTGFMAIPIACGGGTTGVTCGDGTREAYGECVALMPTPAPTVYGHPCGPGTHEQDGSCLLDPAPPPPDATDAAVASLGDYRTLCVGTTNRLYAEGSDDTSIIQSGPLNIEGGTDWQMRVDGTQNGLPSRLQLIAGGDWTLTISSISLGTPLTPGIYEKAQPASDTDPGRPGFDLAASNRTCGSTLTARFDVLEAKYGDGGDGGDGGDAGDAGDPVVDSITVTFELHCNGDAFGPVVHGCAHYSSSN
jgi:hypothetical protein